MHKFIVFRDKFYIVSASLRFRNKWHACVDVFLLHWVTTCLLDASQVSSGFDDNRLIWRKSAHSKVDATVKLSR